MRDEFYGARAGPRLNQDGSGQGKDMASLLNHMLVGSAGPGSSMTWLR